MNDLPFYQLKTHDGRPVFTDGCGQWSLLPVFGYATLREHTRSPGQSENVRLEASRQCGIELKWVEVQIPRRDFVTQVLWNGSVIYQGDPGSAKDIYHGVTLILAPGESVVLRVDCVSKDSVNS